MISMFKQIAACPLAAMLGLGAGEFGALGGIDAQADSWR
jgi:hypothetical protein